MKNGNGHNGHKKSKKLTLKQKKFVKAYIENGNGTKAAEIAGYKHPNPQASQTLAKLSDNDEFIAMMEKAGLSDKLLLKKLREGCNADDTKFFAFEGTVIDERTTTDFPTRHKYLETAFKLRGRLSKEHEAGLHQNNLVIILGGDGKPAALDAEII